MIRTNKNQWLIQLLATKLSTGKYHKLLKDRNQSQVLEEMLILAEETLIEDHVWQKWIKD